MDDLLQRLGQKIRELRQQRGWSQEEFADVCGVHRTYMGHLERGEKNLSFRSMARVATALNVSLSSLLSGLESEDAESGSVSRLRGRRSAKGVPDEDRSRLLKELAVLEHSVSAIKEITLGTLHSVPPKKRTPRH